MTREEIHNEIGNLVKLIEINNNRMFLNDADFQLDLDLLRSHIVKLYGLYDQLSISQPDSTETVAPEPPKVVKKPEPVVIQAKPKPRPKKVEVEEEVEPEVEAAPEPVVEAQVETVVEEVAPEPVIEEVPVKEEVKETPPPPVVEKPKASHKIKNPVPNTDANDVYARLKNTKIDSIKKGISISKRYEVQNELFGNNPEAYNDAIKKLDNQASFDEAMAYLEGTLMVNHQWAEDDVLVDELRILLYRRYS